MDTKATAPKVGAAGGVAAVDDDFGGDGMQCSDHPYKNNTPAGGICALCLQEKLGKLVSSSSSSFFIASSSSSSPSFRSDNPTAATTISTGASLSLRPPTATVVVASSSSSSERRGGGQYQDGYHRSRMRFLLAHKKKEKAMEAAASSSVDQTVGIRVSLKRCKSTATPGRTASYFFSDGQDSSPRRRGFWSFLHHFSRNPTGKSSSSPKLAAAASSPSSSFSLKPGKKPTTAAAVVGVDPAAVVVDGSPANSTGSSTAASSFGRKVSRSRSVGCGSRSFSGDLFERISTGLGDCTLRRVESQREGKRAGAVRGGETIGERVRCGGIFGGFITASSTSSSSSSSYWVSRSAAEENGKGPTVGVALLNGRSWRWGWAFASPMRAFSKPPTGAAFPSS